MGKNRARNDRAFSETGLRVIFVGLTASFFFAKNCGIIKRGREVVECKKRRSHMSQEAEGKMEVFLGRVFHKKIVLIW